MEKRSQLRTWIEIDSHTLRHNVFQFKKLIGPKCKLMAVVKSNAYGHGLVGTALMLKKFFPSIWFGVDSLVEGLRLRKEGVKNPILVLGSTLPALYTEAARKNIALTFSNMEALKMLERLKLRPSVHIKIDTGMHRQGFLTDELAHLVKVLKHLKLYPQGIYTHFAAAKDRAYPTATLSQLEKFQKILRQFGRAGFKHMIRHAAASGGTLLFPETHLDMVRLGMSLWGYWPSPESKVNVVSGKFGLSKIILKPILSWKAKVVEVKKIPAGSLVGYDFTERVNRPSRIAILPVGYWHGFDRGLSSKGSALIRGRRAKILGRVSMDMAVCDVTGIPGVKVGDAAVLIGKQGREEISAEDIARLLDTSPYEILTRINPLIERIYR